MGDVHRLSASLYVPAVHDGLRSVLWGLHPAAPRSVIACTEDAIGEMDVDMALANLHLLLRTLPRLSCGPLRFIRPRSPAVLRAILGFPGIENVHGFVIPKSDAESLPTYLSVLGRRPFLLMPILETAAVFDREGVDEIRNLLGRPAVRPRIVALRIGGNDLLRLLGLKRLPGVTIYDTPLGTLIPQLVMAFKPHGYRLTGVACDQYTDHELLRREVQQDRRMGLVGKTAIHPTQVSIIQDEFTASAAELRAAAAVSRQENGGAFGLDGMMLEPAVHLAWAQEMLAEADLIRRVPQNVDTLSCDGSDRSRASVEGSVVSESMG
jgi:citrate lyase beta subunit